MGLGLGWLVFARPAPSTIPATVPEAVAALIADRCAPFVEEPGLFERNFDGRGMEPVEAGWKYTDRYTILEGRVSVDPTPRDGGNICSVSDEFEAWSDADRKSVIEYALALGRSWSGPGAIELDLSRPEIPFQVIFRPEAGEGPFLMVLTAPVVGDRLLTNVTVGWARFEAVSDA